MLITGSSAGIDGTIIEGNPLGEITDKLGNTISPEEQHRIIQTVGALPVNQAEYREEYIQAVKESVIVILRSPTGSGKSTQVPKNIMLAFPGKKIIVTQPRVISTISNAKRVSTELLVSTRDPNYTLGHSLIGYETAKFQSNSRGKNQLTYTTAGLQLMRSFYNYCKNGPDILFLDEAHHYGVDIEILMWLFRRNYHEYPNKKLVIMSATLSPDPFINYFQNISSDIPIIDVPGRLHKVSRHDDAEGMFTVEEVLEESLEKGSVQVFVDGKRALYDFIDENASKFPDVNFMPLHAELTDEEQQAALLDGEKSRVVVSTNVAQESITPVGIKTVIDFGEQKISYYDTSGVQVLESVEASQASCTQRAGRAGRIEAGSSYRFNPVEYADLPAYEESSISGSNLSREVLLFASQGKSLLKEHRNALKKGDSLFCHSINVNLVENTQKRLGYVGALDNQGNITQLGEDMLAFGIDVFHARMLIEGVRLGISDYMVYVCALLSVGGILSGENIEWKNLITVNNRIETDLSYQLQLLKIFSAYDVTEGILGKLIKQSELDAVDIQAASVKTEDRIFERIDLNSVGIKNSNFTQLMLLVESLSGKLKRFGILDRVTAPEKLRNLKDPKTLREIMKAIAAGSPEVFVSEGAGKFQSQMSNTTFQASKNSITGNISFNEKEKEIVGSPFIIRQGERELRLLSGISHVDHGDINAVRAENDTYESVIQKKRVSKITELDSQDAVIDEYNRRMGGVNVALGVNTFIEVVLPYLLVAENTHFKKTVFGSGSKKKTDPRAEIIEERMAKITQFIKGRNDIAHRINMRDISGTIKSFKHDSYLIEEYKKWQKHISFIAKKRRQVQKNPKGRKQLEDDAAYVEERSENTVEFESKKRAANKVLKATNKIDNRLKILFKLKGENAAIQVRENSQLSEFSKRQNAVGLKALSCYNLHNNQIRYYKKLQSDTAELEQLLEKLRGSELTIDKGDRVILKSLSILDEFDSLIRRKNDTAIIDEEKLSDIIGSLDNKIQESRQLLEQLNGDFIEKNINAFIELDIIVEELILSMVSKEYMSEADRSQKVSSVQKTAREALAQCKDLYDIVLDEVFENFYNGISDPEFQKFRVQYNKILESREIIQASLSHDSGDLSNSQLKIHAESLSSNSTALKDGGSLFNDNIESAIQRANILN